MGLLTKNQLYECIRYCVFWAHGVQLLIIFVLVVCGRLGSQGWITSARCASPAITT